MGGMLAHTVAALVALAAPPSPSPAHLPATVAGTVAGNVVVLTPADAAHRRVRILVDTGGYDLIDGDAATRLGLARTPLDLGGRPRATVAFPDWSPPWSPVPATRWLIARPHALRDGFAPALDATLGPSWLLERTLTVDYPRRTIVFGQPPGPGTPVPLVVGVGRSTNPALPPTALATVGVTVAGEPLTMLLDTGATARVRPAVARAMPDRAPIRQVCLVQLALLERWHRLHPAWRYAPAAFDVAGDAQGAASPAIRVPDLRIGRAHAWPTWFVARRDATTFAAISKQMRRTVVGDLGGDALRRWRVTFDLRHERLTLR